MIQTHGELNILHQSLIVSRLHMVPEVVSISVLVWEDEHKGESNKQLFGTKA